MPTHAGTSTPTAVQPTTTGTGTPIVSLAMLEAFKQSGLFEPGGLDPLRQFYNAQNKGLIDDKGMPTQTSPGGQFQSVSEGKEVDISGGDLSGNQSLNMNPMQNNPILNPTVGTQFYGAGSENTNLTSGQTTLPTTEFSNPAVIKDENDKDIVLSGTASNAGQLGSEVDITNQAEHSTNLDAGFTPKESVQKISGDTGENVGFGMPDDYAEAVKTHNNPIMNPTTASKSIDASAQEDVTNAKQEIEIGYKKNAPPTTLFGMAAKGLDKSGFTDWSGEKMGQSFGYGMGQFGDIGKGQGFGQNIMSGLKGGAGMLGAAAGGIGAMASPVLGALGSGLNVMGRAMSGMQMPQYGPPQGQQGGGYPGFQFNSPRYG